MTEREWRWLARLIEALAYVKLAGTLVRFASVPEGGALWLDRERFIERLDDTKDTGYALLLKMLSHDGVRATCIYTAIQESYYQTGTQLGQLSGEEILKSQGIVPSRKDTR